MPVIKVAIVDDHRIFRLGVQGIIGNDPRFKLVGEFADSQILNEIPTILPDIVICDLTLGKESGIALVNKIKQTYAHVAVLVMSMHKDEFHITHALESGADGYLYKDDTPAEVVTGLLKLAAGEKYYSIAVNKVLRDSIINNPATSSQPFLTKKEREIIHYILEGLTSKEIASELGLSARTIETHRYNILNKLGLKSTPELVKRFTEQGL